MLAVQDVGFVQSVHLLEEDEGENGVRSKASVIRREAFPEREEALGAHDAHQHLLVARVKRRDQVLKPSTGHKHKTSQTCANADKY